MAPPHRRETAIIGTLVLTGLSLRARGRPLLTDLTLAVQPGQRLAVVGGNGSGKTTLLRALAGLDAPAAGRIERPAGPPGMHFQDGALWPHLSVARHLSFVDAGRDPARCERLLETFDLWALRDARPDSLSGGERVRLGLARALAGRPAWLLLDEPFAHLDPGHVAELRESLPPLIAQLGGPSVVVVHDADDLALFGDRVLCLVEGGGHWLGDVRQALTEPPTVLLAELSQAGTVCSVTVGADGRAALPWGGALAGRDPGARLSVLIDARAVRVVPADGAPLAGLVVGPDRRGGAWLRVDGRLLRSATPFAGLRAGQSVGVALDGTPRVLEERAP